MRLNLSLFALAILLTYNPAAQAAGHSGAGVARHGSVDRAPAQVSSEQVNQTFNSSFEAVPAQSIRGQTVQATPPQNIRARVVNALSRRNTRATVNFGNIPIAEGLSLGLKYRYGSRSGLQTGLYARTDTWIVRGKLKVGDILEGFGLRLPVLLNLEENAELTYFRQYPTSREAVTAPVMGVDRLPVTIEKARLMGVGDLVSMPVFMNLMIGGQTAASIQFLNVGGYAAYMLRGTFTLQVLKAADNKLRLRLFAGSSGGTRNEGYVGFNLNFFGITGLLESAVKQIVNIDLIRGMNSNLHGELLLFDYEFNIDNSEARMAYESILNSTFRVRQETQLLRQLWPDASTAGGFPREAYMSNLKPAEDLAQADLNNPNPRVKRWRVENSYTQSPEYLRLGLLVNDWRREGTYSSNFFTFNDVGDNIRYIFNPSFTHVSRNNVGVRGNEDLAPFINAIRNETRRTVYAVMSSNARGNDMHLLSFGNVYDRSDTTLNAAEQRRLNGILQTILPANVYAAVDWKNWGWANQGVGIVGRQDVRVNFRISLRPEALRSIRGRSVNDIYTRILPILGYTNHIMTDQREREEEARRVARTIYEVANEGDLSPRAKVEQVMELRDTASFTKVGVGLITALLTKAQMERDVFFNFSMTAKDMQEVQISLGHELDTPIYNVVNNIEAIMNDRNLDTRVFSSPPPNLQ